MENYEAIAALLQQCENIGGDGKSAAPPYIVQQDTYKEAKTSFFSQNMPLRTMPLRYDAGKAEIFVVSDLHIAAGRNKAGVYQGTENFFSDDAFYRFLEHAHQSKKSEHAELIINGDIFDFLRIVDYPGRVKKPRLSKRTKHYLQFNPLPNAKQFAPHPISVGKDIIEWKNELAKVGIVKTAQELVASVSKKEMKYGLQTDDYKTIYKLIKIRKGHPRFFAALALWLYRGNKLVVLKGNHDLELYWLNVRNYLRLILAEEIAILSGNTVVGELRQRVLPTIAFFDDAIEIDGDFYVEHGHRYDKFTMVLDSPELKKKPTQINLPFGSFFNRYLINRVELFYPFIDNVRPSGNVLPMLMKENFPLGLKVLFQHIPFLLRILFTNFRYVRFMLHKLFVFLIILAPVVYLLYTIASDAGLLSFLGKKPTTSSGWLTTGLTNGLMAALGWAGSYLLARAMAWLQLDEPSSLDSYARQRFEGTDYRIMTMGHTHNPGEYLFKGKQRFYNTGTWIPVVEISTADIREDKTYTFLHLVRDDEGKLQVAANELLQRWNDDAERADLQVLVQRK